MNTEYGEVKRDTMITLLERGISWVVYSVHEIDGVRRFPNVFSVAGFLLHCIHSSWVGDERDQILVYKQENLPLQTSLNGCLKRFWNLE